MHRSVRRIILVRHGESIGNIDAAAYGKTPDNMQELTSWGEEQADRAGKRIRSVLGHPREDCRFFISPYKRSHQTFEIMAKHFHKDQISFVEDPRLREQDWGNFQDTDHMKWQQKERRRFGVFYYRFSEGESGADVYDRVSSFMETLVRDSFRSKPTNYVLISHGITVRMFLARFYHWPVEIVNKLHNFYNGQSVVMERCPVSKKQYTNLHIPRRTFFREPSYNETSFVGESDVDSSSADYSQFQGNYDEVPKFDRSAFMNRETDICGERFLLTSLLLSDPPGPPEQDICYEKIEERRKTSSPLLGL